MPSIQFFASDDLPKHFEWQVRSFMRMHWTFLFGPEGRLRPGLCWLETLNPIHVVLSEGDVVISYGAIVHKELAHAGEQFQTCGLHGVLTFPDFRNEGYASQLVSAASQQYPRAV